MYTTWANARPKKKERRKKTRQKKSGNLSKRHIKVETRTALPNHAYKKETKGKNTNAMPQSKTVTA
jgi:hypothetical protein